MNDVGAVAIGRNEGQRLRICLESLREQVACTVYVDSGSTDGSVQMARALGVDVVELEMSRPFTAARARNAGLDRLLELRPQMQFVHFVDGDCEVVEGWVAQALAAIRERARCAAVWGRRCERHPQSTVYNRLTDLEWRLSWPYGEVTLFGGDVLVRIEALNDVGGFDSTLIAGEEPELCFRMRERGWTSYRLDADMTIHDAAITRFSQWWRRLVRAGHAFAEGAWMHGRSDERYCVRESVAIWCWALVLPLVAALTATVAGGWGLLLLLAYPVLALRVYLYARRRGARLPDSGLYALSCVAAKFPQWVGQVKFLFKKAAGRQSLLIEYK